MADLGDLFDGDSSPAALAPLIVEAIADVQNESAATRSSRRAAHVDRYSIATHQTQLIDLINGMVRPVGASS